MLKRLRTLWTPPVLADPEQSSRAELLVAILRTALVLLFATLVGVMVIAGADSPIVLIGCALGLSFLLIMALAWRGRVWVASWSIPGVIVAFMTLLALTSAIPFDITFGGLLLATAVATLLLGLAGALLFGALTSALTLGYFAIVVFADGEPPPAKLGQPVHALLLVALLIAAAALLYAIYSHLQKISAERKQHFAELSRRNQELANAMTAMRVQAATLEHANGLLEQEIEQRQRVQAMLHSLVSGTASVTGDDFMRSLSLQLVHSMNVRYVLITEVIEDGGERLRTLACRDREQLMENFEYSLPGTPCEEVVHQRHAVSVEAGVQLRYPADTLLAEMGCEGYYAEPLTATGSDTVLGHLALMDVSSLRLDEDERSMMKVFAARTAAELERKLAAEALAEERALLAERVDERTSDLLRANRELHRALQLRDEFLASVSHELRTPLNVVIGLSDALAEGVYGDLNEKQLRSLFTLNESGRHLLNLINDILDVAKAEAGQMILMPSEVKLDELCQACLSMIRQVAEARQIHIHYQLTDGMSTVRADGLRLKQVLVNLLSNAVKFTEDGGEIGLEVAEDGVEGGIKFVVWDTGIGIAAGDIPRLFQPFVQLDTRLSRKYSGTGLGLVLVRRLVELHQGSVSVDSVVGQGTRVVVSLPVG